MGVQLKLLLCVAAFACLLESSSCENKKKILVNVPHVIKHLHHTHLEPVHVHKINHQKKNHHHKHGNTVSVRQSGWESRSQERPRLSVPFGAHESEDYLLDSYEYGRESFWDGGSDGASARGRVKGRRQPYWEDSLEEPIKLANVEAPVWMSRGPGDYGEEGLMSDEHGSRLREHRGYSGGGAPLEKGQRNNGHVTGWRSNQEGGWKPVVDYGNLDGERVPRGREKANGDNQYTYSREAGDAEYPEYRQTKEKTRKKGHKKDEQKTKWNKQIKEVQLINEEDVQRIIDSLQRDQYQQQNIEKPHQIHLQHHQILNQIQPTTQQPLLLSQHQQMKQTVEPSYRTQAPTAITASPLIQIQYIPQPQPPSWSPTIQPKKPDHQWSSPQTPLTTHSPKMAWSGLHMQLPQTTMWHVQHHDVGSTSGLPVQVISSGQPHSASTPKPPAQHQTHASDLFRHQLLTAQPQIQSSNPLRQLVTPSQPQSLASDPLQHHVLPPAGWPMDQRSQGVKQTWQQSVQTSGRDGPASSYKVEVINYMDSKRP